MDYRLHDFFLAGAGAMLAFGLGCEGVQAPETSSTTPEALFNIESDLLGNRGGLSSILGGSQACFDEFRNCQSADGSDVQACAGTLQTCLTAANPVAGQCGGASDGGRAPGAGQSRGGQCGQNVIPTQDLQGCKQQACRMVNEDANSTSTAESSLQTCVGNAFGNGAQKLCDKARELCSKFTSAAEICGRIEEICNSATSDGGTLPLPTIDGSIPSRIDSGTQPRTDGGTPASPDGSASLI